MAFFQLLPTENRGPKRFRLPFTIIVLTPTTFTSKASCTTCFICSLVAAGSTSNT